MSDGTPNTAPVADEAIPAHVRHDAPPAPRAADHDAIRLERLRQATVATSIAQVAEQIGVSRTALSLILSGQYPANPGRVLDRFERHALGVDCPHLGQRLTAEQCRAYHARPRPNSPLGLQHWRACRACSHRRAGGRS